MIDKTSKFDGGGDLVYQPGQQRIIYDIGANNGDDVEYYLKKSDFVVAVEANPELCKLMEARFSTQIAERKLKIVNCVLTAGLADESEVDFYLHRSNHVLSTMLPPPPSTKPDYEIRKLPQRNLMSLLRENGAPYYIKIDIEGCDHILLEELFLNNCYPPYISAESHDIEVFSHFVASGAYRSFKLMDGESVSRKYRSTKIQLDNGAIEYSFKYHSAGPFGNDIRGPWMTPNNFFHLLGTVGLGWKDIHASRLDVADPSYIPTRITTISANF